MEVVLSGTDRLYHIVAMHGAKVNVTVKNFAVVTVTSIKATIEIYKETGTKTDVENSGIVRTRFI